MYLALGKVVTMLDADVMLRQDQMAMEAKAALSANLMSDVFSGYDKLDMEKAPKGNIPIMSTNLDDFEIAGKIYTMIKEIKDSVYP
jgi:hypothetical protein